MLAARLVPPAPCPRLGTPSLSTFLTWRWTGNYGALVFSGGVSGRAWQDPAWEHRAASLHPKMGGSCALPQLIGALSCFPPAPAGQTVLIYIPPSTNKEKSLQPLGSTTLRQKNREGRTGKVLVPPPQCHGIRESPAPGPVLARWLFGDCSAMVIFSR